MLVFDYITDFSIDILKSFSEHPEDVLFFDIETTGLSPDSSYVYLIGCAFASGSKLHIKQWFMEEAAQERELLSAFFDFSRNYKILVHYNGTAFDVPYIQKKWKKFHLTDVFEGMQQCDLYKKLIPLKKFLNLANLKQQTVEAFCGMRRKDPLCGKDLIPAYTEFVGRYRYEALIHGENALYASPDFQETGLKAMPESPAEALLHVLLLHNQEDLGGLLSISPISAVPEFLEGNFSIETEGVDGWKRDAFPNPECRYAPFSLFSPRLSKNHIASRVFSNAIKRAMPTGGVLSLSMADSGRLQLLVPVFHGTLKYFFEDYQDYYYLPAEDCALHKSVAEFVDKAYRKKATRDTCYQKKTGSFLPQPKLLFAPAFRETSKSAFSYFEPVPAFWEEEGKQKAWVLSLLQWLIR